MPWDPELYHKFQKQRSMPFEDVFSLIQIRPGMRVVDLGCGTGELTRKLSDRLPGSDVLGIDSSPQMLAKTEAHVRPGVRFELRTIEDLGGKWDLIFSHAALHWIDDHPKLISRLLSLLNPGGQLAVQAPSMHRHESHLFIAQIAKEEPFLTAMNGWTREYPVLNIDEYSALLHACGADQQTVFEKIYPHIMENSDGMADWNTGTAMVPYLEHLPQELRDPFVERYRSLLRQRFPETPILYPFRRTIFWASVPKENREL